MVNEQLLEKITLWFVLVGAVNVGAAALGYNLIQMIVGAFLPSIVNIIYYVVGASGIYQIYKHFK